MIKSGNLASDYRPQTFADVVGQDIPKSVLKKIASAKGIAARSIFLKGSYGSGKCVSPDTILKTNQGLVKAIDLPNIKDTTFSILGNKNSFIGLEFNTDTLTKKVKTVSGRQFEVTPNHPVLTWDSNSADFKFVPASHLKKCSIVFNDLTPIPYNFNLYWYLLGLFTQSQHLSSGICKFEYDQLPYSIYSFIESCNDELKSDNYNCFIVGPHSLKCSDSCNSVLYHYFNDLDSFYEEVYQLPVDYQFSFALGILNVLATVTSTYPVVKSRDLRLLQFLQHFVSSLGFHSILKQSNSSTNYKVHNLIIQPLHDLDSFITIFRNYCYSSTASKYKLPGLTARFIEFVKSHPIKDFRHSHLNPLFPGVENTIFSLYKYQLYYQSHGIDCSLIPPYLMIDFVDSITDSSQPYTIDLQCEFLPVFYTSGIITHNTTLARIFAKAMNCEQYPTLGDVCNSCPKCQEVQSANSSLYYEFDSSVVGNVEKIRSLQELFSFSPNGRRVVVFDEVHACLAYGERILCVDDNGNRFYEDIGKIVHNRLPYKVLSLDDNGEVCVKPIVSWVKNPKAPLYRVYFKEHGRVKAYRSRVTATADHKFLVNGKYVPLSQLAVGSIVSGIPLSFSTDKYKTKAIHRSTFEFVIDDFVEQFILGSCLGDSSIYMEEGHNFPRLIIEHGEKQYDYFLYKEKILGDLLSSSKHLVDNEGYRKKDGSKPKISIGQSKSRKELIPYFNLTGRGKKVVTYDWLNRLNEIGLAFWIMDDGSFFHSSRYNHIHGGSISTHGFSYEENVLISEWFLQRWGINSRVDFDKRCNKYYILFDTVNANKLAKLVAPHIIPSLQYKVFPYEALGGNCSTIVKKSKDFSSTIIDYEIIAIEEAKDTHKWVYDLEVADTHNYFCRNINVHNCSNAALNAMLKMVEEGVPNTCFVFASTEDILPTLKSRSICLDVTTIPYDLIKERVKKVAQDQSIIISDEALSTIALKSNGHMRDALSILQLYSLAGEDGLKSSYLLIVDFFRKALSKKFDDALSVLHEILKFNIVDVKNSIYIFLRNIYCADKSSFLYPLLQSGMVNKLFQFFFSPVAQQAIKDEVGMELLLRSFLDKLNSH